MKLSKFFPFENYILVTRLTPAEVKEKIGENMQLSKHFWSFKEYPARPYEGEVYENTFIIERVNLRQRNPLMPVIVGGIEEVPGRTKIAIVMRPSVSTIIFMFIFLGITGVICLWLLVSIVQQFSELIKHGISGLVFIPFVLFLFGYLFSLLVFKAESSGSKEFLAELLKEEKEEV